jgi:hypothetical protein
MSAGIDESLSARRDLSDAAKALLEDKAFGHAMLQLRKRWFAELMEQTAAGERQNEIAARLRALETIPAEIAALMSDYRVAAMRERRHG